MADFRPSPRHTQPGVTPQAGQTTDYVDSNGDLYTALLTWVGPEIDGHPNRLQCSATRVQNGVKDRDATILVSNPVALALLRDGWIYDVDAARVKWCPCKPPWPDHCP